MSTTKTPKWAVEAAAAIIDELRGRNGFKALLDTIDPLVMAEISEEIADVVVVAANAKPPRQELVERIKAADITVLDWHEYFLEELPPYAAGYMSGALPRITDSIMTNTEDFREEFITLIEHITRDPDEDEG